MSRHISGCLWTRRAAYPSLGILLLLAALWPAAAQFTINGVSDRTIYTDTATFTVVTQAGYSYAALLNGAPAPVGVAVTVRRMDYYDLWAWRTNLSAPFDVTNRLVRFIVVASDRGSPETGLIKWTPYPPVNSTAAEMAGAHLDLLTPQVYPAGLDIPVVARVENADGTARRVNGWVSASGFEASAFRVVRGVGFGLLPPAAAGASLVFDGTLRSLTASRAIQIESNTVWTPVAGTLGTTTWPANSRIHVTGHLTIPAGATLTIEAGTVVRLNPGVNITNTGRTVINGTAAQPVVFTPTTRVAPEQRTGAWGGFFLRGTTAELIANHAILTGSGAAASISFSPGSSHRSEQPLLLVHSGATVRMTNCALINHAGQIGNGYYSSVTLDHCLVQRAITCGEWEGCTNIIRRSALLEFPSIDGVYDAAIADADYDGIYMIRGTNYFADSLVGFAKDDAIDSGSGGPGTVTVDRCWIESALHEALAWSGEGRWTWTYDSVLLNCGQGIECGWSTTNASSPVSPICYASNLFSTANSVGARYGDNYTGTSGLGNKFGFLTVTSSFILYNYRDVWGQVWDNTWNYRVNQMDIRGNYLTAPNTNHPLNSIWNPAADASRLAPFMSTPPAAPVGIGLALWTNRFSISEITNGLPVRLSSFTTHFVSVGYVVLGAAGQVASGTVEFAPGETVKTIPPVFPATNEQVLEVVLVNPLGGELSDLAQAWFFNTAGQTNPGAIPLVARGSRWSYWDKTNDLGTAWRSNDFVEVGWSNGLAQLGFGDNDETTLIANNRQATTYFRHQFVVADPTLFTNLWLWLLRDDGGVVYLNGVEVFRSDSMPPPPFVITYQTLATNYNGGAAPPDNTIDRATISPAFLRAGTNLVAVEIHQQSLSSSDVSFDFALTGLVATASSQPLIRQSPTNQTVAPGGTAVFTVDAAGAVPLGYQWWHNATQLVISALGPVLTLTNVSAAEAGSYHVVVVNADGWATSQVATLTVLDPDTDADGLPDQWERDHGLIVGANDAGADPDHDGATNLAEYIAGTDPQEPSSYLKIETVTPPAPGSGAVLTFQAVAGKSYAVLFTETLAGGPWNLVTNLPAAPANQLISVPDPAATNRVQRFYRLQTPTQP